MHIYIYALHICTHLERESSSHKYTNTKKTWILQWWRVVDAKHTKKKSKPDVAKVLCVSYHKRANRLYKQNRNLIQYLKRSKRLGHVSFKWRWTSMFISAQQILRNIQTLVSQNTSQAQSMRDYFTRYVGTVKQVQPRNPAEEIDL